MWLTITLGPKTEYGFNQTQSEVPASSAGKKYKE